MPIPSSSPPSGDRDYAKPTEEQMELTGCLKSRNILKPLSPRRVVPLDLRQRRPLFYRDTSAAFHRDFPKEFFHSAETSTTSSYLHKSTTFTPEPVHMPGYSLPSFPTHHTNTSFTHNDVDPSSPHTIDTFGDDLPGPLNSLTKDLVEASDSPPQTLRKPLIHIHGEEDSDTTVPAPHTAHSPRSLESTMRPVTAIKPVPLSMNAADNTTSLSQPQTQHGRSPLTSTHPSHKDLSVTSTKPTYHIATSETSYPTTPPPAHEHATTKSPSNQNAPAPALQDNPESPVSTLKRAPFVMDAQDSSSSMVQPQEAATASERAPAGEREEGDPESPVSTLKRAPFVMDAQDSSSSKVQPQEAATATERAPAGEREEGDPETPVSTLKRAPFVMDAQYSSSSKVQPQEAATATERALVLVVLGKQVLLGSNSTVGSSVTIMDRGDGPPVKVVHADTGRRGEAAVVGESIQSDSLNAVEHAHLPSEVRAMPVVLLRPKKLLLGSILQSISRSTLLALEGKVDRIDAPQNSNVASYRSKDPPPPAGQGRATVLLIKPARLLLEMDVHSTSGNPPIDYLPHDPEPTSTSTVTNIPQHVTGTNSLHSPSQEQPAAPIKEYNGVDSTPSPFVLRQRKSLSLEALPENSLRITTELTLGIPIAPAELSGMAEEAEVAHSLSVKKRQSVAYGSHSASPALESAELSGMAEEVPMGSSMLAIPCVVGEPVSEGDTVRDGSTKDRGEQLVFVPQPPEGWRKSSSFMWIGSSRVSHPLSTSNSLVLKRRKSTSCGEGCGVRPPPPQPSSSSFQDLPQVHRSPLGSSARLRRCLVPDSVRAVPSISISLTDSDVEQLSGRPAKVEGRTLEESCQVVVGSGDVRQEGPPPQTTGTPTNAAEQPQHPEPRKETTPQVLSIEQSQTVPSPTPKQRVVEETVPSFSPLLPPLLSPQASLVSIPQHSYQEPSDHVGAAGCCGKGVLSGASSTHQSSVESTSIFEVPNTHKTFRGKWLRWRQQSLSTTESSSNSSEKHEGVVVPPTGSDVLPPLPVHHEARLKRSPFPPAEMSLPVGQNATTLQRCPPVLSIPAHPVARATLTSSQKPLKREFSDLDESCWSASSSEFLGRPLNAIIISSSDSSLTETSSITTHGRSSPILGFTNASVTWTVKDTHRLSPAVFGADACPVSPSVHSPSSERSVESRLASSSSDRYTVRSDDERDVQPTEERGITLFMSSVTEYSRGDVVLIQPHRPRMAGRGLGPSGRRGFRLEED